MPKIAIVGASSESHKFGNKSVRAHRHAGWTVYPINPRGGSIEGLPVLARLEDLPEAVDRIALYVPPEVGVTVLDAVAAMAPPPEVYINPGAGSAALRGRASELAIPFKDLCAIVAIGESPSDYP